MNLVKLNEVKASRQIVDHHVKEDCQKLINLYNQLYAIRSEIDTISANLQVLAEHAFDLSRSSPGSDPEIEIRA